MKSLLGFFTPLILITGCLGGGGNNATPLVPALSLNGASPSISATPTFRAFNLKSGDKITLHEGSDCSGDSLGKAQAEGTSLEIALSSPLETDGTYNFYVQREDADGTKLCSSQTVVYVLDTTAPAQATASLGTGLSAVDNDTTPTITASGLERGNTASLHASAGCNDTALAFSIARRTSADLTPSAALSDGSYTFYVKARDLASNWSCSAQALAYTLDTVPPPQPTLSIGSGNLSTDNDPTPNIAVSGVAIGDTLTLHKVSGCTDGPADTLVSLSSSAELTHETDLPSNGDYTFYVNVLDRAGNATCSSAGLTYTFDQTFIAFVLHSPEFISRKRHHTDF